MVAQGLEGKLTHRARPTSKSVGSGTPSAGQTTLGRPDATTPRGRYGSRGPQASRGNGQSSMGGTRGRFHSESAAQTWTRERISTWTLVDDSLNQQTMRLHTTTRIGMQHTFSKLPEVAHIPLESGPSLATLGETFVHSDSRVGPDGRRVGTPKVASMGWAHLGPRAPREVAGGGGLLRSAKGEGLPGSLRTAPPPAAAASGDRAQPPARPIRPRAVS